MDGMKDRREFDVRYKVGIKLVSSQIVTVILLMSLLMVTPICEADSGPTTYFVPDDYPAIQQAIDVASNGDTIIVKYDTYYENVYVGKQLTIIGVGSPEVNANGGYYAFELRADGITLDGFHVTNSGPGGNKAGIRVTSNNNIIRNNTVSGNKENGILLYKGSNNNMVSENTISNSNYGIHLESSSDNTVIDNIFANNGDGIHIVSSYNNIIEENALINNNYYGIHLRFSNNNGITENEVTNSIVGIYLWNSNENVIEDNIVSGNSLHGIDLRNSISNTIYNNRLLNSKNAYDNGNNNWNAIKTKGTNILGGPYIAGNYWSDFSGSDLNFDGIIDSVNYISGGSSKDNYPLCPHENYAPYPPSSPAPSNEATNVDEKSDLNWGCTDPDWGDVLTYDVYFGTTNPPSKIESNQSSTSYDLETMGGGTTYYWQIVARDDQNHTTESPIWNFKTKSTSSGGSTRPPGGGFTNQPPVADGSAGGPYQGFVGEEITFDGSLSYDSDGIIQTYEWDFGDKTKESGEIVSHAYSTEGIYSVILTVTDNLGFKDSYGTSAIISKPNIPPSTPYLNGPKTGYKDTECSYTTISTDLDNDAIQYIFDWGDTKTTTSDFLPNGTSYTAKHSWTAAGRYVIKVKTSDNETESGTTELIVLIDAQYTGDIGYLIDSNGDGAYDSFYGNGTGDETSVEKQDDGTYLIDNNGDGKWNYEYDFTTNQLAAYADEEVAKEDNFTWIMITAGLIFVFILVAIIGIFSKRGNKGKR